MSDQTPTTEAGRGLRAAWSQLATVVSDPVHLILAIEAEAAAQARAEGLDVERLREAVIDVLGDDEVSTYDGSMSTTRAFDLITAVYARLTREEPNQWGT